MSCEHDEEIELLSSTLTEDPEFHEVCKVSEELRSTLDRLSGARDVTLKSLRAMKHEVEISYDKSRKARIGGTSATVVGSSLAILGFGLAFVTFGASVVLVIAGSIIASVGGITIGGAEIGYLVVSHTTMKNAEKHVKVTEH